RRIVLVGFGENDAGILGRDADAGGEGGLEREERSPAGVFQAGGDLDGVGRVGGKQRGGLDDDDAAGGVGVDVAVDELSVAGAVELDVVGVEGVGIDGGAVDRGEVERDLGAAVDVGGAVGGVDGGDRGLRRQRNGAGGGAGLRDGHGQGSVRGGGEREQPAGFQPLDGTGAQRG